MKKFTMLFAVVLAVLFISVPAFACKNGDCPPEPCCPEVDVDINTKIKNSKIQGAIGDGNVGIQSNGAIKVNTINTGDTTVIKDNIVNRSGILSGNTLEDSIVAGGDVDNSDNSILKNADLSNSQNGLVNQKGHGNQQGLVNVKGDGHQVGLINTKGSYNHSGNSHNRGNIIQSKGQNNNKGIIIQGVQGGAGGSGGIQPRTGPGFYDEPNGDQTRHRHRKGGKGGGAGGDVNIDAFVDNSTFVEDKREFAPGPATVIAGFADYVGSETPGYTYSTIEEMLTFGNVFTESQLKSMAGKRGIRSAIVDITMMDSNMARQKPTIHPTAGEKTVTVYYKAAVPSPIRRGAFITVAMKSVKGISVESLGKSGLAVLEVGGNSLFLTAEGFDITQSQHSVAVGPGISFSSVGGSDGSKGVTGGGGLNYSYGVFGKNYKPYLRSMALYVEDADHKYARKGEKVQK